MMKEHVVVIAMYLFQGGAPKLTEEATDRYSGQIGFARECAEHAREVGAALDRAHARRPDMYYYPGVLEYELIEPLGAWLATQPGYVEPRATAARFLSQFRKWVNE